MVGAPPPHEILEHLYGLTSFAMHSIDAAQEQGVAAAISKELASADHARSVCLMTP